MQGECFFWYRLTRVVPGMLKSRDRSRSRDVSRPLFDGLSLGLGLEGSGLGLEVSGLGLKKH